jgi:hypothetical protein
MPAESTAGACAPASALTPASRSALEFFCDEILHRRILERQVGIHALELGVFGLQLANPFQIRCFHAAILRLPLGVRGIRDAVLAA